jgi:protein gp37
MKITKIQWCHSTINCTSGCDGCELLDNGCYAQIVHENRLALGPATAANYAKDFREVRLIPGRMQEAARWGAVTDLEAKDKPWFTTRRRHIFISDMSDALSRAVSFDYLKREIIDVVTSEKGKRHVWQWLTKRPTRMAELDAWLAAQGIAWPENLWAGTSVTSQRTADQRVPELLKVRASVRFLSCEPLFEAVSLGRWLRCPKCGYTKKDAAELMDHHICGGDVPSDVIHWVIVGGMSGTDAVPFDLDWARSLRDQCKAAGVPCFTKQLGKIPVAARLDTSGAVGMPKRLIEKLKLKDAHGGDWSEWPADLCVREMPRV